MIEVSTDYVIYNNNNIEISSPKDGAVGEKIIELSEKFDTE